MKSIFSKRLRELRLANRKVQQDVATYINVTRGAYCLYEIGEREPKYEILIKLAEYYNVSIDYLLGFETEVVSFRARFPNLAYDPKKEEPNNQFYNIEPNTTVEIGDNFVTRVINSIEDYGLMIREKTFLSRDYGIDLLFLSPKGTQIGIECKYSNSSNSIGIKTVQTAYAGGTYYGCDEVWIVGSEESKFTTNAQLYAQQSGVKLVNISNLSEELLKIIGINSISDPLPIPLYRILELKEITTEEPHKKFSVLRVEKFLTIKQFLDNDGQIMETSLLSNSKLATFLQRSTGIFAHHINHYLVEEQQTHSFLEIFNLLFEEEN